MHVLCPHCHNPIEIVRLVPHEEIACPSCGSSFRLEAETTTSAPPPGERKIGRFEVLDTLGHGAFGTVYKARDPTLGRLVAVKVPRAGNLAGAHDLDRFLREARSAARLRHPAIVPIHEVGQHDGLPYLVSDLVEGVTLADLLSARRPGFREAAGLVAAVADALQYAHEHGVVHRDVKPSNVMIADGGAPFVMDFGLAKRDAGEITMTAEGQVLGTPAYMPPEQARGEGHAVDARGDVYSLGVVLYQLLTGELPFRGTTRMLLHQVLHDEPRPPRGLNDRIPRDLETVCLKAMAKEPHRRYESAGALADDLRRWLRGEPIRARPVGRAEKVWRWCRRNPRVAALTAAVGLLLLAVAVVATVAAVAIDAARDRAEGNAAAADRARQQERAERERAEGLAVQRRELLADMRVANGVERLGKGDVGGALVWFADALKQDEGDPAREHLHRVRLASLLRQYPRPVQVWSHPVPVQHVEFSPDGNRVLAGEGWQARLWDVRTGQAVRAISRRGQRGPITQAHFSPDGRGVLAVVDNESRLEVVDLLNGRLVGSLPKEHRGLKHAEHTADGRRALLVDLENTVHLWDLGKAKAVVPPFKPGPVFHATFSPDGRRVAVGGEKEARVWDLTTGQPAGPPLPADGPVTHAAFDPSGRSLATASGRTVRVWDIPTGRPLTPPLDHRGTDLRVTFSPGGTRLLAVSVPSSYPRRPGESEARIWTRTGEPVGDPLRCDGWIEDAAFSPNGLYVVTAGGLPDGSGEARVWGSLSGAAFTPPLKHAHWLTRARFSPDGNLIAVAGTSPLGDTGEVRLWQWRPRAEPVVAWGRDRWGPVLALSADGSRMAARQAGPAGEREVRVWATSTGEPLTPPLPHPVPVGFAEFSPDGRRLLTTAPDSIADPVPGREGPPKEAAWVWDVATGELAGPPLRHPDAPVRLARFSADGRRVLTVRSGGGGERAFHEVRAWEVGQDRPIGPPLKLETGFRGILDARFSPDGTRVGLAAFPLLARAWDVATGNPVTPVLKIGGWLGGGGSYQDQCVSFSPDGRHVAIAFGSNAAQVWDIAAGRPAFPLLTHEDRINHVTFSPDGRLLLTASDRGARLWRAADGTAATPPLEPSQKVTRAAFGPDGRQILTVTADTLRVWDPITGHPVTPPIRKGTDHEREAFSADGRRLVVVRRDVILAVDLAPDTRPAEDLVQLTQVLTGHRVEASGSLGAVRHERLLPPAWYDSREAAAGRAAQWVLWHPVKAMNDLGLLALEEPLLGSDPVGESWQALRARYPDEFPRRP